MGALLQWNSETHVTPQWYLVITLSIGKNSFNAVLLQNYTLHIMRYCLKTYTKAIWESQFPVTWQEECPHNMTVSEGGSSSSQHHWGSPRYVPDTVTKEVLCGTTSTNFSSSISWYALKYPKRENSVFHTLKYSLTKGQTYDYFLPFVILTDLISIDEKISYIHAH